MNVAWRAAGIIAYAALMVITVRVHSYWLDAVFWLLTIGAVGAGLVHERRGRKTR